MAARIPKNYLVARFSRLAREMDWNTGIRWHRTGDNENRCIVGHVALEYNSVYGWNINQTVNDAGGERRLLESCSARELDAWITGALFVLQAQEDARRERKRRKETRG